MQTDVTHYQDEHYPLLPNLDYARRWIDGLLSILEGYLMSFSTVLITIGISFSMYDFLTNGQALNDPTIFKVWAIVQTIAIDAQFVNMWYRLKVAIREDKKWQVGGYLLLGLLLAFVTFGASVIPALQKSMGISFDGAIIAAGINPVIMIWARSFVAILLAIVGAFQRTVVIFNKSGKVVSREPKKVREPKPANNDERVSWFKKKISEIKAKRAEKKSEKEQAKQAKKQKKLDAVPEQKSEEKQAKNTDALTPVSRKNRDTKPLEPLPEIEIKTDPELEIVSQEKTDEKQAKNRGEKSRIGLTFSEAARLKICQSKGIENSDIRAAVLSRKIIKKSDGTVAKSAVESWAKTFKKSQIEEAS